jgi:2'-deoxynucleoside 5'-phosphate N-hydrolase
MKVFIAVSYEGKERLSKEIDTLEEACRQAGFEFITYVRKQITAQDEKKLMDTTFSEITTSDIIIAEVSEKVIGVGIEIGYAKALNKKIIYIHSADSERSTTVGGTANIEITYSDYKDLFGKIKQELAQIMH